MDTATVIIRVIRSFEHRNVRNILLKEVPLSNTTEQLVIHINEVLPTAPGLPPPFRKYNYDTLKVAKASCHEERLFTLLLKISRLNTMLMGLKLMTLS